MTTTDALIGVASVGVVGTVLGAAIAQFSEFKRTAARVLVEDARRQQDRADNLAKEKRERNYADHAQILVYLAELKNLLTRSRYRLDALARKPNQFSESLARDYLDELDAYMKEKSPLIGPPLARSTADETTKIFTDISRWVSMSTILSIDIRDDGKLDLEHVEQGVKTLERALGSVEKAQQVIRAEIEPV